MRLKKWIALALVMTMMIAVVGCGSQAAGNNGDNNPENEDYVTIGEIIDFEEGKVHVITGDIVDIYEVNDAELKNYYLGQTVKIKDGDDGKYEIKEYKIEDFTIKHTNMGHIIYTIQGETSVSEDYMQLTVTNKSEEKTFELYEPMYLDDGTLVTVDYMILDNGPVFLQYFNEETKVELTVNKIRRDENGAMVIETTTAKEIEYIVTIDGSTEVMFNYSELKEGAEVTVYGPEVMLAIYPNQMTAKKIVLN